MKKTMETIERSLTEKVTGAKKETKIILGIVFFALLVFGVYNMGHHLGEFLYYVLH